ncbi:tRNA (5-methylaminomethyl-2-thiouridine)(34)-methyltransferase MnmD [Shewanella dokdonensis]|uniref:tRNA (5-methylaminomethyl-2-thiouridine)(34)-methyltransferase MnmD n=1 Tax=Shewanella dokdonensis TaxID=712036 RepID=A0ABX8DHC2_9GAMM|nr:tRNA (5-methylaminomethyl-2-thiouridine)(34)-methyltransferase MnmD [Shewanella dokdonensis]MCL1075831.1 tRNA (5-methylaminomethyl-2-thiouridine)(34)-methyltransferase MnmD [Shewanella dokdonensis]QVK24169.1 tRNA (5-methylaminomethyl-2-thiouridine)(34)-methyltransferase MnmD [Shewanella dokdonensis]
MAQISLQVTDDGSHTLFNSELNETYHSHRGAIAESRYVFIAAGFDAAIETFSEVSIFEVGFGTGLNALLTLGHFQQLNQQRQADNKPLLTVRYVSVEPYPLAQDLLHHLNYKQLLAPSYAPLFDMLHAAPWEQASELLPGFWLTKCHTRLEQIALSPQQFNLIYFDAFAPNKQPDVWRQENLAKCYQLLQAQGLLVSYCANGQFKRDLKAVGFTVKAYPGALGKREMTRAWRC